MPEHAHTDEAAQTFSVVGLGELIWDLLPEGRELGGAPSNFAYLARLLGDIATVASRVGDDALGREARERLTRAGISAEHLQVDREHPTGTVGVRIGAGGEPQFKVNRNSAWDYIEMNAEWEQLASRADAVCFGTLGQRRTRARATIRRFLALMRKETLRVFDVNLRHSFFSPVMLRRSLELANVVKLNHEELSSASAMLNMRAGDEATLCRELIESFDLRLVALTKGKGGCLLVTQSETVAHPGYVARVVDTIGCGDAFAAALTHCLLRGVPLEKAAAAANRAGAWVAARRGATPVVEPSTVTTILGGQTESEHGAKRMTKDNEPEETKDESFDGIGEVEEAGETTAAAIVGGDTSSAKPVGAGTLVEVEGDPEPDDE